MAKILIVDDEVDIRTGIAEFARFQGYDTAEASDGAQAVDLCMKEDFDLIIMDIMMPRIDGFSAYKKIRESKDIPVIMLSARGEEYDKLYGFELGIEDYVVKPFSLKELMARIQVVLRRRQAQPSLKAESKPLTNQLVFDNLIINTDGKWVSVNNERISLTPKEFDLLCFLAENEGIVFSRETLLEKVWGFDYYGDGRTVDAHIKMLRRALGPCRHFIITHRGTGYKFEA